MAEPFPFPLVVLDFEATALALTSYPIEVGIATATGPNTAIESWSALIQPDPAWDIAGQWDPDAERVHHIRRWDLREGLTPAATMFEVNARIPAGTRVWCDGGPYDLHWLQTLASAAGTLPTFELADLSQAFGTDLALIARFRDFVAASRPPHRAGPDAARLCAAMRAAITSTR